jgi:hypothetical protein
MQAKDIPDTLLLGVIRGLMALSSSPMRWTFIWDVQRSTERHAPGVPPKVVMAKIKSLIKRKLLDGCPCGCRGDFVLTAKGEAALEGLAPLEVLSLLYE